MFLYNFWNISIWVKTLRQRVCFPTCLSYTFVYPATHPGISGHGASQDIVGKICLENRMKKNGCLTESSYSPNIITFRLKF